MLPKDYVALPTQKSKSCSLSLECHRTVALHVLAPLQPATNYDFQTYLEQMQDLLRMLHLYSLS
jgi:hypothetical protein